jgi:hypothetical protein
MFKIAEGTAPEKVGEGTDETTEKAIVSYLEKKGHVIRTSKQDQDYVESQVQPRIDKVLGERNTQIEQTVLKITGLNKNNGEKFYEYMERAVADKLKEAAALSEKVKEYESKGVEGSALAQQYKKELEQAQAQVKQLNEEWQGKFTQKESEVFGAKVESEIERSLSKLRLKFRQDVEPAILEDAIAGKLYKFRNENKAKDLDGHIIYTNPAGATITSKADGKPKNTDDILSELFVELIDKKREQGGAGSGGKGEAGDAQGKWKDISIPATVTSKVKLHSYLSKDLKMNESTKEFSEAYENLGKSLPLK